MSQQMFKKYLFLQKFEYLTDKQNGLYFISTTAYGIPSRNLKTN